jgi:nucleoside-diphosphate-sugar epimerase
MASRLALLTGATGFLGGHLAHALIAEGWRVRALARGDPSRSPLLEGLPLEFFRADLSSAADLASAASGCDAIVHAAGRLKARNLEEYREVNLRGTERLVAAAASAAAEAMFVLVSSQAAAGPAREGRPVAPEDPARPVSWYGISKLEGERALQTGWRGPWLVLRPGVIYGPGDRGLLAYFRMACSGWLPVPAANSHIQIGSAARVSLAVARAAGRRDLRGRTAFLCDPEPVTVYALAACIGSLPAKRVRLLPVPGAAVRALGLAETLREKLTGRSRTFNADKARELLAGEWTCEAGLRRELELPPPVPLQSGLRETWDWYSRQGWLIL